MQHSAAAGLRPSFGFVHGALHNAENSCLAAALITGSLKMVKPVGGGLERQFGLLPSQRQCARIKSKLKTLRPLDLGLLDMILQETLHQNATVVCVYIHIYIYVYIYMHTAYIVLASCIFLYTLFFRSPAAFMIQVSCRAFWCHVTAQMPKQGNGALGIGPGGGAGCLSGWFSFYGR